MYTPSTKKTSQSPVCGNHCGGTMAFNPGALLGSLIVSLSSWLIVGVFAYIRTPSSGTHMDFNGFLTISFMQIPNFYALIGVIHQCSCHPNLPFNHTAAGIASILGCFTTIAFCIATSEWRTTSQHKFLIMGSVYVSWGLEWYFKPLAACLRWLEQSTYPRQRLDVASSR
ncbi:uncharacterized protein F5Z01DRAFT_648579 [Emericellopsis atlantica]|uniref:Uncharacterized protein n=1 Tax=Emericellopsis atlantica TaxID=2614577 RepID=A0A9P7ZQN2_9HYPO|nr:uncharacterized protein F5Z01DRAFT_648579 [Emericellopsis atlantica]KAG9256523.1 hypothetical protein F5Z01DRAFT_648579 [Emericellopsis atlantica]